MVQDLCKNRDDTKLNCGIRCWFELLQQPETQNNQRYTVTQTIPSQCKKDWFNVYKNRIIVIIWSRYVFVDNHSVELLQIQWGINPSKPDDL